MTAETKTEMYVSYQVFERYQADPERWQISFDTDDLIEAIGNLKEQAAANPQNKYRLMHNVLVTTTTYTSEEIVLP